MCEPKSKGGLGFKDLQSFNTALLDKQGWHIIQHPQSLLPQVHPCMLKFGSPKFRVQFYMQRLKKSPND